MNLRYDTLLSNAAFNFNLRHYNGVTDAMAHADDAAPSSSAVHTRTSEVTIDVVASLTYSSPTLAVSLRGAFYYGGAVQVPC